MSDETFKVEKAKCIQETPKAILVEMPGKRQPMWIPQSQVHEDSEVWKEGDTGRLVVSMWFAEQRGWLEE
jgi:hypothetical protein